MNISLCGTWSSYVVRLGNVGNLDAQTFPHGANPGCWGADAAQHFLHLLSELLVQQSVHKRVDSRIDQDHRVSNSHWDGTSVIGCHELYCVDNFICAPTYSKYYSDSYDHQGNTLSHPHNTLCQYRKKWSLIAATVESTNEAEGSAHRLKTMQKNTFVSFVCQTAKNCNNSY